MTALGLGRALELVLSGDFVDARKAEQLGMVNHCAPHAELEGKAYGIAHKIATLPPPGVQTTNRLTNKSFQNEMITALELSSQAAITATTDHHKEAVAAFRKKRKGNYKGA